MGVVLRIGTVYSRLQTDDEWLKDKLWRSLRFRERNCYHNSLYRQKKWDGFKNFFTKEAGQFLTGLLPEVVLALKLLKIDYVVDDRRQPLNFLRESINEDFLWCRDHERPVILRDYQVDLANQALKYKRGIIHAPTSAGKAQPLNSLVATPDGFKRMGDIKVGDRVLVPSGGSAVVNSVFPQGKKRILRIIFSNGDHVDCCKDHLWKVNALYDQWQGKVLSAAEIKSRYKCPNGANRYNIDTPKQVDFDKKNVPLDPYFMGVLLGDGTFRLPGAIGFSTVEQEILQYIESQLKTGYKLKRSKNRPCDYRITSGKRGRGTPPNPYVLVIEELKLQGLLSNKKFIPDCYLVNEESVRLNILQGLMDTGGEVSKKGQLCFTSTSENLASGVAWLVHSLGGVAFQSSCYKTYTYKGVKKKGKKCYLVRFTLPEGKIPFKLSWKKDRCKLSRLRNKHRTICDVKELGEQECQCIMVDHPDHLYITDNFVITHNTFIMLSVLKCLPPKTCSLVLVDTKELVHQNYEEIKRFGFNDVGMFYGEVKKPNYITVCLINSAPKLAPLYPKVRSLIVDEIHAMMAPRNIRLYKQLTNADIRIGFSATPFTYDGKDKCQKYRVKGHIGGVLQTDTVDGNKLTTAVLQEREVLSPSKGTFYVINQPQRQYDIYGDAVTYGIAQNQYLNEAVARLIKTKLSGRTLLVVDRIEHGERLMELIPGAFWLHGSQKKDIRFQTVENLKHYAGDFVGIAIDKIVNKGLNVFIHNLVNCAGGKADHLVIQRMGRGLRTASDKQGLNYYDFYFKINPYLQKHSEERIRILLAEGHSIEIKDAFDF